MKTIKQWLKEGLSEEDYEKAKKYEREKWEEKSYSFKMALSCAFNWYKTDEEDDYWRRIRDNGGSLQTNNTKQNENN